MSNICIEYTKPIITIHLMKRVKERAIFKKASRESIQKIASAAFSNGERIKVDGEYTTIAHGGLYWIFKVAESSVPLAITLYPENYKKEISACLKGRMIKRTLYYAKNLRM